MINSYKVDSPALNGLVMGGLGGAGGGFAGGAAGAWLTGGDVWQAGISGMWSGLAIGGGIGAGTASYQALRSGINPITGQSLVGSKVSQIASERGIYSTNKGVNNDKIDSYLKQMQEGTFLENPRNTSVGGFKYKGRLYFNEGNHRINAAIEYYLQTGNDRYINILTENFRATPYRPSDYGLDGVKLPTRR